MADVADEIMPQTAMRATLKQAQTPGQKVPIAVALDADKGAVVLTAKKGKAKSLKSAFSNTVKKKKLEAKVKLDSASLFYGYGSTVEGAEGILLLALNKAPPGGETFAHKVFMRVKGAGFGKVVLSVDSDIEAEAEESEFAETASVGGAPVGELAPSESAPPSPSQGEVRQTTTQDRLHDPAGLKRVLGALVQQVVKSGGEGGKPNPQLLALAEQANEALRDNRLSDAATAIGKLKNQLDIGASTQAGKVDLAKPRLVWLATRKKVHGETDKLRAKILEHYQSQGIAPAIIARFNDVVADLFGELDESLADTLDAAGAAKEPEQRQALLLEAQATIGRYEKAMDGPTVTALEDNPFEKLAVRETLANSLKMLAASIK